MNPDFKILIRKSLIFLFPVLLWIMTVIFVDPFNYFNYSNKISEQSKLKSAQRLNSLLFNSIQFKNNPKPNIIIGDSFKGGEISNSFCRSLSLKNSSWKDQNILILLLMEN